MAWLLALFCAVPGAEAATAAFTPVNQMQMARSYPCATLLPNGKVLVSGGYGALSGVEGDTSQELKSSELYDPAGTTWGNAGPMNTSRFVFASLLLPNGKVLAVGGKFFQNELSSELYDPADNSWTLSGNLKSEADYPTLSLLPNGKVLMVGGIVSAAQVYTPSAGTWAYTTAMPGGVCWGHAAVTLPDGKVLVMGGNRVDVTSSICEVYDPSMPMWMSAHAMGTARIFPAALVLPNGKVLVAGGRAAVSSGEDELATCELYNPSNDTWSPTGSMTVARVLHSMTLLPNGKVLALGGAGYEDETSQTAELYDPATGQWKSAGMMNDRRETPRTVLLPDGKVFIVGGRNLNGSLKTAELYDPAVAPPPPMIFNGQPASGSVSVAQDYVFSVLATGGEGAISYQWYRGELGDTTQPIAGATTNYYKPTPLSVTSSFWVRATSLSGAKNSDTATVTITTPAITGGWTVNQGKSATFRLLDGAGFGTTFQWQHFGADISPNGTNPNYMVFSAQPTDAGPYRLKVTTTAGTFYSNTVSLTVVPTAAGAPVLSVDLADATVISGGTAVLDVESPGPDSPTYLWYSVSDQNVSTPIPAPEGGHTHSLTLANVTSTGRYKATATNATGTTTSRVATLTVIPQATVNTLSSWHNAPVSTSDMQPGWIASGNGKMVAIGKDGASWMTSPTGEVWTPALTVPPAGTQLGSIAFGNGLFVAAGAAGKLYTSPDGVTWTLRNLDAAALKLQKVAFGDGKFVVLGIPPDVAVPVEAAFFTSTDGITWGRSALPSATAFISSTIMNTYADVAVGNGRVVCFLPVVNATWILVSTNGVDWLPPVAIDNPYFSVVYGNGRFLCAGATSFDGLTWTNITPVGVNAGVNFASGLFVARTSVRSIPVEPPTTTVWISPDGSNWIQSGILYGASTDVVTSLTGGLMTFGSTGPSRQNLHSAVFFTGALSELPVFMERQPASVNVTPLQKVTLTAVAGGGNPSYQWYMGTSGDVSNPISGATASTLTPGSQIVSTSYWVRATNSRGSIDSATATIAISNDFLYFSKSVPAGAPASFSFDDYWSHPDYHPGSTLITPGWPEVPATFSWEHNGEIIPNQTFRRLSLDAVHLADAGTYRVIITTAAGSLASNSVTLTVEAPVPTTFNRQPQGATFTAGGSINFYADMAGQPPYAYQWYIGVSGDVSHPVAGATHANLLVTPASTTSYWVRVTTEFDHVDSQTATATVVQPPVPIVFQTQPVGGTIMRGQNFTLSAQASGPEGVKYQWYRGQAHDMSTPFGRPTTGTTFTPPTLTETTSFWVRATSADGSAAVDSLTATVTVTIPPSNVLTPAFDPGGPWMVMRNVDGMLSAEGVTLWQVTGLPAGVVYDKYTGHVTGGPRLPGKYTVRIVARNATTSSVLIVTIVVAPLPSNVVGSFAGIIGPDAAFNNSLGGRLNITITAAGAFSGSYTVGPTVRPFTGRVNQTMDDGRLICYIGPAVVPRTPLPYLLFTVYPDSVIAGGGFIGDINGTSERCTLRAVRNIWTGNVKPSAFAGVYTSALQPSEEVHGDNAYPQGTGYFGGTIGMNGAVTMAARLADNSVVTAASILGPDETIPLHWLLYGGTGSAQGWQQVAVDDMGVMMDGDIDWLKKPQAVRSTTRSYKAGFPVHRLHTMGCKLKVPAAGQIELGLSDEEDNAMLMFSDGGLENMYSEMLRITTANKPMLMMDTQVTMVIDKAQGKFSGVFKTNGISAPYFGIFVPRMNMGLGHFQLPQSRAATSAILSGGVMLGAP